MKKKSILIIIGVFLAVVLVASLYNIVKIYDDYKQADDTYEDIQNEYVSDNEKPTANETNAGASNQTDANMNEETEGSAQEETTEPPISVDFDSLCNRNKDVNGWLYCPDTTLNYPVVQGKDNTKYLQRDLDGKYLASGTLFVDFENGALGEDTNYIIYGHNMKNGTMFGMLTQYKEQSYYDQHPTMYYLTPNGNYEIELVIGVVVQSDDRLYELRQDKTVLLMLINRYREKSTFHSPVEISEEDLIITLSTCSYEFNNARYVLVGKLMPL